MRTTHVGVETDAALYPCQCHFWLPGSWRSGLGPLRVLVVLIKVVGLALTSVLATVTRGFHLGVFT